MKPKFVPVGDDAIAKAMRALDTAEDDPDTPQFVRIALARINEELSTIRTVWASKQ